MQFSGRFSRYMMYELWPHGCCFKIWMYPMILFVAYTNTVFKDKLYNTSYLHNPWQTNQSNIIIHLYYTHTDTQSMHKQTKQTCIERHPHKFTIPYLFVHSVAFKYNVADLNTVCYSVKLQGDNKINI